MVETQIKPKPVTLIFFYLWNETAQHPAISCSLFFTLSQAFQYLFIFLTFLSHSFFMKLRTALRRFLSPPFYPCQQPREEVSLRISDSLEDGGWLEMSAWLSWAIAQHSNAPNIQMWEEKGVCAMKRAGIPCLPNEGQSYIGIQCNWELLWRQSRVCVCVLREALFISCMVNHDGPPDITGGSCLPAAEEKERQVLHGVISVRVASSIHC